MTDRDRKELEEQKRILAAEQEKSERYDQAVAAASEPTDNTEEVSPRARRK